MAIGSPITENQQETAAQIAHDYIRSTKKWTQKDYYLKFLRHEGNLNAVIIVLDVVHQDDLKLRERVSSTSVQLHIDLNSRKVLKELAYQ